MKLSPSMHLPKEDGRASPRTGDLTDLDFETIFGKNFGNIADGSPNKPKRLACPECQQRGQESYLSAYQLNFQEAMYMCPTLPCVYPMKEPNLIQNFVFKRDASTLASNATNNPRKKSRKSSGYSEFFADFDFDSFIDFSTQPDAIETSDEFVPKVSSNAGKQEEPFLPDNGTKATQSAETEHLFSLAEGNNGSLVNVTSAQSQTISNKHLLAAEVASSSASNSASSDMVETVKSDPVMATVPLPKAMHADEDIVMVESLQEDAIFKDDNSGDETIWCKFSRPRFCNNMIQWTNFENSCWLDAIMQVLVSSSNMRAALNFSKIGERNLLKNLVITYDRCQQVYHDHLSNPGNGERDTIDLVSKDLGDFRKRLLEILKRNSSLKHAEFQSLLEMFPLVLKTDSAANDFFKVYLIWNFECSNCGHTRARRSDGDIVSFPNTLNDFHPLNAQFYRPCYECKSSNGMTTVHMEKLPPCLVFHFQRGLPHSNLRVLDFAVQGMLYSVFAVVQYVLSPFKHFITWVKDVKSGKWLCCDDLKSSVCAWQSRQPNIPSKEIHMVFWERQLPCDPQDATNEHLATVLNAEAAAIGEEIPVELFFSHEDETIVIEDERGAGCPATPDTSLVRQVPYHSNIEPNNLKVGHWHETPQRSMQLACASSANVPYAVANGTDSIAPSSQLQPSTQPSNGHSGPIPPLQNSVMHVDGEAQGSCQFHPSMFVNGGLTVIPSSNGRQAIQLMAPANTCSIYIVTGDSKNQQTLPLYNGTRHPRQAAPSRPMPCSFIDNPHSYNMVAQGSLSTMVVQGGSVNSYGRRNILSSKRPKRQYRLSGYPKRNSSKHFSPMRVVCSAKQSVNTSDVQSAKSFNSKTDSETLSEVSELSDQLPDFDSGGNRRGSVAAQAR